MSTDLLDDEAPAPSERAFTHSIARTFRGLPLQPFAVRRQIAAQALGNRVLCGTARLEPAQPCRTCVGAPAPSCPNCHGSGFIFPAYPGMFADIVATLFLCLRTSTRETVNLALTDPDAVRELALQWSEAGQLILGSAAYQEASRVYWEILEELSASRFAHGEPGGAASPNG